MVPVREQRLPETSQPAKPDTPVAARAESTDEAPDADAVGGDAVAAVSEAEAPAPAADMTPRSSKTGAKAKAVRKAAKDKPAKAAGGAKTAKTMAAKAKTASSKSAKVKSATSKPAAVKKPAGKAKR